MDKILLFLILSLCLFQNSYSQKYSTKSKKAISYFEKSLQYYRNFNYNEALEYAEKAIKKDKEFVEVYYLLSDIYGQLGEYNRKIQILKKAIQLNPAKSKFAYLNLCKTEIYIGKYIDAKKNLLEFRKRNPGNKYLSEIKDLHLRCEFAINAIENPVEFKAENLGDKVNTKYDDYSPVLTLDEKQLIFTVGIPRSGVSEVYTQKDTQEDFFVSEKSDSGIWQKSKNIGKPVNTPGNEGAQSISPDGKFLFFTSCNNILNKNHHGKSYGSCDLFYSIFQTNKWSQPENIGKPINSKYWETQPSFSSDGKTLYFVSNRPGGKGNSDIWTSELKKDGTWKTPRNIGDIVNTKGSEQYPFIHPDNKTLYFSSDGHLGMGRTDLFVSRKDSLGNWTKPKNLGYPINTYKDEVSLIVNAEGNKAFFSSDNLSGFGRLDLYSFDLNEENRPERVTYLKGIVYDSETRKTVLADFELINLQNGKTVTESFSDPKNGGFLICLPTGNNYALNVTKSGYLFHSENFSLANLFKDKEAYHIDIPLVPIKIGKKIVLKNIFFELDSYELKHESYVELNKAFDFLKKNSSMKIEIGGHTDNSGTKKHNEELSSNRAQTVFNYFISKGIEKKRLSYKGYADNVPISDNSTKEGRAKNRRTEFQITGK